MCLFVFSWQMCQPTYSRFFLLFIDFLLRRSVGSVVRGLFCPANTVLLYYPTHWLLYEIKHLSITYIVFSLYLCVLKKII